MIASQFPGQTLEPIAVNPHGSNDDEFSLMQKAVQLLYNIRANQGSPAPPSGAAGGDLAGTYPNPTVNRISGNALNSAGARAALGITLASVLAGGPNANGLGITNLASLGFRDTSAAFDATVGFTSSVALSAARALTFDVTNTANTLKLAGGTNTFGGDLEGRGVGTGNGWVIHNTSTTVVNIGGNDQSNFNECIRLQLNGGSCVIGPFGGATVGGDLRFCAPVAGWNGAVTPDSRFQRISATVVSYESTTTGTAASFRVSGDGDTHAKHITIGHNGTNSILNFTQNLVLTPLPNADPGVPGALFTTGGAVFQSP